MTTKFNKDMYAKMRSKKDEPLSSIGKKGVRVTGKGPSTTLVTSVTPVIFGVEIVRTTSPAVSVKEIPTPSSKRPRISGKEKEKADSHSATVWGDEGLAVDKAHGVITAEDLKVFTGVLSMWSQINKSTSSSGKSACAPLIFFSLCTDDFSFLFRCWGRVSTLLLSTSLRRPRWRH